VRVLLDTNILLRSGNAVAADSELQVFLSGLLESGAVLCICSQNLVEFWAAASRPLSANGFGWSAPETRAAADHLVRSFELLPDPEDLVRRWLDLCTRHAVLGRQAYDARLVALMQSAGIAHLVTLNAVDFKRYPGLTLLSPDAS
jgi:predicted nucleic acid-binding protein